MPNEDRPRIVIIGGGSGASNMAQGVAEAQPDALLSVVVATGDNGGSTGRLRASYPEVPAVGDVRKVLSALSLNRAAADVFESRIEDGQDMDTFMRMGSLFMQAVFENEGEQNRPWVASLVESTETLAAEITANESLAGHSYGNIFLLNLAKQPGGNLERAADTASTLLRLGPNRRVFPVTNLVHDLVLYDGDTVVRGQTNISDYQLKHPMSARVELDPTVKMTEGARMALMTADIRAYGPGSDKTSVQACTGVADFREAVRSGKPECKDVFNVNLELDRETKGLRLAHMVRGLERQIGKNIDCVVANDNTKNLPEDATPIDCGPKAIAEIGHRVELHSDDLVARDPIRQQPGDLLAASRTRIRHDAQKVGLIYGDILSIQKSPQAVSSQ